jgi:hypothetical protein
VWALVQASSGSSAGGSGVNLALLVPGIAILVLVGIIVAVRIARGRAAQAASPPRPARR